MSPIFWFWTALPLPTTDGVNSAAFVHFLLNLFHFGIVLLVPQSLHSDKVCLTSCKMGERWRAREERGGIHYSASNERPVPGDSYLLHIINLSKYLYSSHYPACPQDKELRTIAHCQFMKQLLHIPSPKTKYLIKEIKINYGICMARCYHACPPAAALFAAPRSQQSSSQTIPPGGGCTSTSSHPIPMHPISSLMRSLEKLLCVLKVVHTNQWADAWCMTANAQWSSRAEERCFYLAVIISCLAIHKHKRGKASNKPESIYAYILMTACTLLSKKFKPSQRTWMPYFY